MKGKTGMSKMKAYEYNAKGSPDEKEADDEMPGFKKGGRMKKAKKLAHGGKAMGKEPKHRLDRKPRASGGRSPYSSAENAKGGAAEDEEGKRDVTGEGAETNIPVYRAGGRMKHHKG